MDIYVSPEGLTFTGNDATGETGEQAYQRWLANRPAEDTELTVEERLEKLTTEYNRLRTDTDNLIKENELLKGCIIEVSQEIYG